MLDQISASSGFNLSVIKPIQLDDKQIALWFDSLQRFSKLELR